MAERYDAMPQLRSDCGTAAPGCVERLARIVTGEGACATHAAPCRTPTATEATRYDAPPEHDTEPWWWSGYNGPTHGLLPPGPWITYGIIAICAGIFVYLNTAGTTPAYARVVRFLAPRAVQVWSGAYWGLVTTAFVHFAIWHVLFNMLWTKLFGGVLEPLMGRARYLAFVLVAAAVSSGAQLAFSEETGIGFSGVVYAMFGFALAARTVEPRCLRIADARTTAWLLGWLVLCIVLTEMGVWRVGNAAHVGGFAFGFFAGHAFVVRKHVVPSAIGIALLAAVAVCSLVYMPWSKSWRDRDAILPYLRAPEAAEAGDPEAQYLYGGMLLHSGEKAEGVAWFRKSAEQGHVPGMNALAWTLATDQEEAFRNGAEAVEWAEHACEKDGWQTSAYIDTLAAAYAEVGRWDDAVATQTKAIEAIAEDEMQHKPSYEARLEQFQNRRPARE